MKTSTILIQNLCVPCNCHCRYCLLSWSNKLLGIDYERSEAYAKKFNEWIKENRPELDFSFYFGYSMEHPNLLQAIDFFRSIGSVNGSMLQFDGMRFRGREEIVELLSGIKAHGVEHLNFTFYGTREYHDKFAGRRGDFEFMIQVIEEAHKLDMEVSVGIPITHENALQIEELLDIFDEYHIAKRTIFVPHEEGRGVSLNAVRFREEDFNQLSDRAKAYFNTRIYKKECEWISEKAFKTTENRALLLSLTPENIEMFENMSFEDTIAYLEKLDDEYYSAIPSLEELVELYGNADGKEYYQQRDLFHHYQRMYIKEHNLTIYDVTDERQCGSRRF